MRIIPNFFHSPANKSLARELKNVLGIRPGNFSLFEASLNHRSVKENADENNERLEYLGDAVLSALIADYLFKKYPYRDEGFLTEMRSKMVNRQQLNSIAVKMGFKRITSYNKFDNALKSSQIFGNALEAVVGAIYIDKGYEKTREWVLKKIIIPYLFVDDLEQIDINLKNKLIGWANKNGKSIAFETIEEKMAGNRRVFTVGAVVDGTVIAQGQGFNKKYASQVAAQLAIEKLQLI
ncbi:MAG: ribonuclease III [Chitinophagaceae bacterium]